VQYKIIDNYLDHEQADEIENVLLTNNFPWFYNKELTYKDNLDEKYFYFIHMFYAQYQPQSNFFYLVEPIIKKLDPRAIIRIKGNLYPSFDHFAEGENHVDYTFDHAGAIYYVNTNNGYTMLNDEIKVDSIKNRLLIFEPQIVHKSVGCTDQKVRANINFNFF
jgi:hypothetical protein